MPYLTEDRDTLLAFRAGEPHALRRVYEHYAPSVVKMLHRGFVFRSNGKPCGFSGFKQAFDLENALQEVFIRAFSERARLGYDGLRPYKGYLFAIARNVVIDEVRRRRIAPEQLVSIDEHESISSAATPASDPAWDAEAKELQHLVASFLEQCDARTKRYCVARYQESKTQEDVAKELGLTRIQIRRIEARFRKDILRYLRGKGYLTGYSKLHWATLTTTALLSLGLSYFN